MCQILFLQLIYQNNYAAPNLVKTKIVITLINLKSLKLKTYKYLIMDWICKPPMQKSKTLSLGNISQCHLLNQWQHPNLLHPYTAFSCFLTLHKYNNCKLYNNLNSRVIDPSLLLIYMCRLLGFPTDYNSSYQAS